MTGKINPPPPATRAGSNMTKICSKCKVEKPVSAFERERRWKNGYRSECKACHAAMHRVCRLNKLEAYQAKERLRAEKRWGNPEKRKRHRELKDPVKESARMALRNAVASGKIVKPKRCSSCREAKQLHGHHDDYSKPFDVRWLCSICHGVEHIKVG